MKTIPIVGVPIPVYEHGDRPIDLATYTEDLVTKLGLAMLNLRTSYVGHVDVTVPASIAEGDNFEVLIPASQFPMITAADPYVAHSATALTAMWLTSTAFWDTAGLHVFLTAWRAAAIPDNFRVGMGVTYEIVNKSIGTLPPGGTPAAAAVAHTETIVREQA